MLVYRQPPFEASAAKIVNVVATGEISGTVNLENLFYAAEDVEARYDPIHHQGCYIQFSEDGPLITMYASGKYIIRANSVKEVNRQNGKLLSYLEKIGVPETIEPEGFELNNVVANASMDREFDLLAVAEDFKYADPDSKGPSGRLSIRYPDTPAAISLFRSGKVMIMGAASPEGVHDIWDQFQSDLVELLNQERGEE